MKRMTIIGTLGRLSLLFFIAGTLDACGPKQKPDPMEGADPAERPLPDAPDSVDQSVTIETRERSVEISDAVEPWPQELPVEVPRYPYGTIRKIIRTETPDGNSWDMALEGLPEHGIRDYEILLKSKGFQTSSVIVPEAGGERGSVTAEMGPLSVVLIGSGSSASLSIIQNQ